MDLWKKWAAVFPVYKNRDMQGAIEEAWELEKQLESAAGYNLWLRTGRHGSNSPPSTTDLKDIEVFNAWFRKRKRKNDISGIFIMLM